MLNDSDIFVVTELSRLGRSTAEVIALVNELVARTIRVINLKQNLDTSLHDMTSKIVITLFSLFAELEHDLMSMRTKEALAAKNQQGVTLGKPKGTVQKSKFDANLERSIGDRQERVQNNVENVKILWTNEALFLHLDLLDSVESKDSHV